MNLQDNLSFQALRHGTTPPQLDLSLLIVFALRGRSAVRESGGQTALEPADLYVIRPLTLFRLCCEADAAVICMRLGPELLRFAGWTNETALRRCLLEAGAGDAASTELRRRYAQLFRAFLERENPSALTAQAAALLKALRENFQTPGARKPPHNLDTLERLQSIMQIAQQQWSEPLSLTTLAAAHYVSAGYLARSFRKHLGMTFHEYLSEIRLLHAQEELETTSRTVTEIALQNGFHNVNPFISCFKQRNRMTPGQYRRSLAGGQPRKADPSDCLQTLLRYAAAEQKQAVCERRGRIDAAMAGTPPAYRWSRPCQSAAARTTA